MERKAIRLQYSGYVIFAARLISVATGLLFQFMLGRAIAAESPEYAIWGNINTVLPYFTLLAGVVPFWVMRSVTRGKEGSAKTGFAINLIFALITTTVYLVIIPIFLPMLLSEAGVANPAVYLPFYLLASVNIIEIYLTGLFEPCLQARTPQSVGYGLVLYQVLRVIAGYVIIIQLGQPLLGAIISTIIALTFQVVFYFKLLASEFKQRIQWDYAKEWLKGSVLIIYSVVGGVISNFIFIMLFYFGGFSSMDIYYAALQIATIISHSGYLSYALYPKLLAERKTEDVTASMKTVLMFAIPMTVGVLSLASSYIVLLRPETLNLYPGAEWVLAVLAIDAFITVVTGIYATVLSGIETVDQEKMSLNSLIRSKLFKYYSLSYVSSVIMIPTLYYVLTTYALHQPVVAAFSVCLVHFVVRFGMFFILVNIVRGMFKVSIPWRSIAKYGIASGVMSLVLILLPSTNRILTTLTWTVIGGIVYSVVLIAIDKETRSLPKAILQEVKGRNSST